MDQLLRASIAGDMAAAQEAASALPAAGDPSLERGAILALGRALECGNLNIAQWLATRFGLTAPRYRPLIVSTMQGLCASPDAAAWLAERFRITPEEISANDNWALQHACLRGRLNVAKWIADNSGEKLISAADATTALAAACSNGHFNVAQWLAERFGLKTEDVRAKCNQILRRACASGNFSLAEWLVGNFNLTAEDARACNSAALRDAYSRGHINIAQLLVDHFSLRDDEIAHFRGLRPSAGPLIKGAAHAGSGSFCTQN
jgi:hypothetical protein